MNHFLKICMLAIFLTFGISSQSHATTTKDSLLTIVVSDKHDTLKILALEQLAVNYRKDQPDSAFYYNQKAIEFAKKANIPGELAEAYREYALTAQATGDYPEATKYYKKALKVHQKAKNKDGEAGMYNDIGISYYYAGNYDEARKFFEKSGVLKIDLGDSIGAGQSFNNTGIMHDIAGNPKDAVKLYLRAISIYESLKDTSLTIGTLANIGLIYIGQKNYNEALKIYSRQKKLAKAIGAEKHYGIALTSEGTAYDYLGQYDTARTRFLDALEIFLKLGDKPLIAQCYNNLSANYELTNEDDLALAYAMKSIKIKKEIGSYGKLAISQIAAGKIYNKKGQYNKAKGLFEEALENATNTGYLDYIIKSHKGLSLSYEKMGNYKKAFFHQSTYISLNDSVTSKENAEIISELEKKYQSERQEQEIELLNKTNSLKDEKLARADEESKRKSIQLYGSMGLGLVLLVLVLLVLKSSRERKRNNQVLRQKNHEITQQKEIVEEQHKEITDSINYAKRIQTALLTSDEYWQLISPEHFVLLKPKDVVSGDFFWAFQTESNLAIWVAADCTGHGVPGAFMSMLGIGFLNEIVVENATTDPGEILNKLRDKIIKALEQKGVDTQQKDGMDLALCVWDKSSNKLSYSGAHNPLWIIRSSRHSPLDAESHNGKKIAGLASNDEFVLYEIKADKQPVGVYTEVLKPFSVTEIQLLEGDTIYTFSDGYADQFGGEKGKKLKSANFKKLLLSIQGKPLPEQKQFINETFENWRGELEQLDDVCVIGVKV